MARGRSERAVAGLISEDQQKGPVFVLADKAGSIVRRHVVDETLGRRRYPIHFDRAIKVLALTDEAGGVVETGTLARLIAVMPFADIRGDIAGRSQQGRQAEIA